ncbi:MAG: TonB family protein, partial [Bacteroidales bacterium]|nr:TonB family protein [Bacteroidales bacterium]
SDLRGVHEYEADEAVLKDGVNPHDYQLFLIDRAAQENGLSLVSGIQSGSLKERIGMMLRRETGWKAGLKALYVIPVIVITLIACSRTVTDYTPFEDAEVIPFQMVDQKPTFNGGDANEFSKWVNSNLVYPKEAMDRSIQGRVTLQFTVTRAGKVKYVKVIRGIDTLLDNEAIRVVSASPDWTPGVQKGRTVDVTYTFPVIFVLR